MDKCVADLCCVLSQVTTFTLKPQATIWATLESFWVQICFHLQRAKFSSVTI